MNFLDLHKGRQLPILGVVISIILMIILNTIFQIPLLVAGFLEGGMDTLTNFADFLKHTTLDNNLLLFLFALGFIGILLGLWITIKYIHKSDILSLFSTNKKIDWQRILYGFGVWFSINIVFHIIDYYFISGPENFVFQFNALNFIILVLVSIVMLGIQTATEELVFRGYFLQLFGAYIKIPIIPILLSGILFGLVHMQNPEVTAHGANTMMFYYIGVGVVLGIVVFLDNRIELAIGFHAANNIFSSTIANYKDSVLRTDALFISEQQNVEEGIIGWYIIAILFVFIVSRKYPFKSLKTLFITNN